MSPRLSARALLILSAVPFLAAASVTAAAPTLQPSSKLWIEGTSTVRGFSCAAAAFRVDVRTTTPALTAAVMAAEETVKTATVTVPAAQLDCGNGKMNEHMATALNAKQHPTITFTLADYQLLKSGDATTGELAGTLHLGGVTKPVRITAAATREGTDLLRLKGQYALTMTEFGLTPPKLMMGTLKVNPVVQVHFDLLLKD